METKWLADFLSLANTKNFTRSSELRFTTQSAFSRRIRALEEWIGAQLFDRRAQPVILTEAGEIFLPLAREILDRLESARDAVRQHAIRSHGTMSIATMHSLARTFLPTWLRTLETVADPIDVSLLTLNFEECISALVSRSVQFMICHCARRMPMDLNPEEYPSLLIGLDALVPLSAPDSAGKPRYRPDKDGNAPYLAYARNTRLGQIIEDRLERDRIRLAPPTFVSSYTDVLQSMTALGYGFTWLLMNTAHTEIEGDRLVRAAPPDWEIPLEVRIFRARQPLDDRGERIWSAIQSIALDQD